MRKKYLVVMIMVAIFTIISLGCSASDETGTDSTNAKGNESEKSGENAGESGNDVTKFSLSMRTQALPYVENHDNINEDKYVKELERITNTEIDFHILPHVDFAEKMTLMLASDKTPDVMMATSIYGPELAGGVEAGAFLPLNDLLEEHGQDLLETIPQKAWDEVTAQDGNIYAIPSYLSNPSRRGTAIRMDLLEKTGLEVPETTDEFLDVLRAFKELGVEHPFKGRNNFRYADTFFGAFDALPFQWDLHEDQVIPKFMIGDRMKEALEFHRTMYEEELIHPEFLTLTEHRATIVSGNVGMWSMNAEQVHQWGAEIKDAVPEAEVAIIPSPKGPDGRGGHHYYGSTVRIFLINSETEVDPAEIIKFFNWQVSDEAETFFTYGIEGDTYTLDDDGNINYEIKDDSAFEQEQVFRNSWLWMIRDETYTEGILELTEEGQELLRVFDEVLTEEGRSGLIMTEGLEALNNNPDIQPGSDGPADFWLTEVAKIIIGEEPIDYYDEVMEKWLNLGGDLAIEEATERYHNNMDRMIQTGPDE